MHGASVYGLAAFLSHMLMGQLQLWNLFGTQMVRPYLQAPSVNELA